MKVSKTILVLGLVFVAISPIMKANIGEFDEVWQKRAEDAKKAAQRAYEPNSENVTNNLNLQTRR